MEDEKVKGESVFLKAMEKSQFMILVQRLATSLKEDNFCPIASDGLMSIFNTEESTANAIDVINAIKDFGMSDMEAIYLFTGHELLKRLTITQQDGVTTIADKQPMEMISMEGVEPEQA